MLAIRLRRAGARKDPHYRIVVTERSAGRDGPFLEILGHYHPRRNPVELVFREERTESWLAQGARMSDTVRSLYRRRAELGTAAPESAPPVPEAEVEAEAAEAGAAAADEDVQETADDAPQEAAAADSDASPSDDSAPSDEAAASDDDESAAKSE